jgi:hypothetical protein
MQEPLLEESNMDDDGKFPRLASDLVDWLDEFTARPEFPMTPTGAQHLDDATVRLGCFQAGARNLVDQLVAWRKELEAPDEGDSGDDPAQYTFEEVLGGGGRLDQTEIDATMVGVGPKRILPDPSTEGG